MRCTSAIFGASLLLLGCSASRGSTQTSSSSVPALEWSAAEDLFANECTYCHDTEPPGAPRLDAEALTSTTGRRALAVVLGGSMPPPGKSSLSGDERRTLALWLCHRIGAHARTCLDDLGPRDGDLLIAHPDLAFRVVGHRLGLSPDAPGGPFRGGLARHAYARARIETGVVVLGTLAATERCAGAESVNRDERWQLQCIEQHLATLLAPLPPPPEP